MFKFLISPAFSFSNDLIAHLSTGDMVEGYKRVLVYPITNGIRFRNLDSTLHVVLEVAGHTVNCEWTEYTIADGVNVPWDKKQTFAATDLTTIVSKIEGFFYGKWSIEKPTSKKDLLANTFVTECSNVFRSRDNGKYWDKGVIVAQYHDAYHASSTDKSIVARLELKDDKFVINCHIERLVEGKRIYPPTTETQDLETAIECIYNIFEEHYND